MHISIVPHSCSFCHNPYEFAFIVVALDHIYRYCRGGVKAGGGPRKCGRFKPKTMYSVHACSIKEPKQRLEVSKQENESVWSNMSTRGLLFQGALTVKSPLSVLLVI